jgi:hypothetical protein
MLVARIRLKKAQAVVDKDVIICLEIMGSVPFRRQITAVIDARSPPFYEAVLTVMLPVTLVSFASTQCHAIIVVPCWKIANRYAEKWCCP